MNQFIPSRKLICMTLLGVVFTSGCATYHAKPLPTGSDLARTPALTVPASRLDLPGLKPHPFNPVKGLDETTVMTLAVLNNPDLKASRLQAGVAEAQVLEAGLLPDPEVNGGLSQSALHTGYVVGLSENIQALLTRGAAKASAKAHAQQVNLEILWQEWQVAERARELFIQIRADEQLQRVLNQSRNLFAKRYRQDEAALRQNNMTANDVSTDLAALTAADTQLRQIQLKIIQNRHTLNELLGLKPNVKLHLIGRSQSRLISAKAFRAAVAALPHHRADLLALQAGYESQEQKVREAVLAQFPAMSAGVKQARSAEEGLHTIGFTINVTLPIFNRNQGQIAIQRATRALLRQTYQSRLDQAVSQVNQIWQATKIMAHQLHHLETRLRKQKKSIRAAERSYRQGNLDAGTYVRMQQNWHMQQAEAIRLRASLERAQAALETLLGLPFDMAAD